MQACGAVEQRPTWRGMRTCRLTNQEATSRAHTVCPRQDEGRTGCKNTQREATMQSHLSTRRMPRIHTSCITYSPTRRALNPQ
jgi:hypothetical protein